MTPDQLDEIEKLARDPKSAAFHDLMARQTIPLVKALREARAEVERLRSAISRFVTQYPWQDGPEIQELKALKEGE